MDHNTWHPRWGALVFPTTLTLPWVQVSTTGNAPQPPRVLHVENQPVTASPSSSPCSMSGWQPEVVGKWGRGHLNMKVGNSLRSWMSSGFDKSGEVQMCMYSPSSSASSNADLPISGVVEWSLSMGLDSSSLSPDEASIVSVFLDEWDDTEATEWDRAGVGESENGSLGALVHFGWTTEVTAKGFWWDVKGCEWEREWTVDMLASLLSPDVGDWILIDGVSSNAST